jgi:hypothetical protein
MSVDKKSLPVSTTINKAANGKTLSSTQIYQHGSVWVHEQTFSDATVFFVKFLQGQAEMGGTNEWGTGTKL